MCECVNNVRMYPQRSMRLRRVRNGAHVRARAMALRRRPLLYSSRMLLDLARKTTTTTTNNNKKKNNDNNNNDDNNNIYIYIYIYIIEELLARNEGFWCFRQWVCGVGHCVRADSFDSVPRT